MADVNDLLREYLANQTLNQQGSLMGSQRQEQQLGGRSPLVATISQILNALNPLDWMGGMGGEGAVSSLARTAKTFKPAPTLSVEELIKALAGGQASMPGRASLQPALRHTPTGEIVSGSIGSGHGPLYEAIPPNWQKQMEHGFLYPSGPFLQQQLIDQLVQPAQVKTMNSLLERGIGLEDVLGAIQPR